MIDDTELLTFPEPDVDAPDFTERYLAHLRADPAYFAYEVWRFTGLDEASPLTLIDADIIRFLHDITGPDQVSVLGPRGVGKTHWGTALGVVYDLFLDPTMNSIIRSKTSLEATKTVKLIREWLNVVPFLRHLKPRVDQTDRDLAFSVGPVRGNRQESVTALGIASQLPGNRAHRVNDDDIETDINTDTEEARAKLKSQALSAGAVRYNPPPGIKHGHPQWPRMKNVGTRWAEDSVHDQLSAAGYVTRAYPLLYPTPQEREHIPNLAPIIVKRLEENPRLVGTKVFTRYRDSRIDQERGRGAIYFGRQFQQLKSIPGEERPPLNLSDLIVVDDVPRFRAPIDIRWGRSRGSDSTVRKDVPMLGLTGDRIHDYALRDDALVPFTRSVGYLDTSGKGTDLFGVSIVKTLAGKLWVPVCRSRKGGVSPDDLDDILALMKYWDVRELYYESNNDVFGTVGEGLNAAMLRAMVKPGEEPDYPNGWACSITPDHATLQKEVRIIDTMGVPFAGHNLVMAVSELQPDPKLELHQQLQYQITRIRKVRKCLQEDGALDSLRGAVAKVKDALRTGSDTQAARKKADLEDKEIEARIRRNGGRGKPKAAVFHKR
jgi:hypothetical protein